jgi:hypothetical protein
MSQVFVLGTMLPHKNKTDWLIFLKAKLNLYNLRVKKAFHNVLAWQNSLYRQVIISKHLWEELSLHTCNSLNLKPLSKIQNFLQLIKKPPPN